MVLPATLTVAASSGNDVGKRCAEQAVPRHWLTFILSFLSGDPTPFRTSASTMEGHPGTCSPMRC